VRALRILRAQRAFFAAARPLKLIVRRHHVYVRSTRDSPRIVVRLCCDFAQGAPTAKAVGACGAER
jgi:hypothetical protein